MVSVDPGQLAGAQNGPVQDVQACATTPNDPLPTLGDDDLDRPDRVQWFRDHLDGSAAEIIAFLGGDGITLTGRDVADVGCGEGIMDLGITLRAEPRRFVGFDIVPTDCEELLRRARHYGAAGELPATLEFAVSERGHIPAPNASFDVVISWSAFEHVVQPHELLREVRRILRPDGVFMLQLWPFFYSEHGSHLWHWFPEGFVNLRHRLEEVEATLRADTETDPAWIEVKLRDYRELNGMTLDQLQRAILGSGMYVAKLELLTHAVHLTPELSRWPLSDLGIAGVKLLAKPQPA